MILIIKNYLILFIILPLEDLYLIRSYFIIFYNLLFRRLFLYI